MKKKLKFVIFILFLFFLIVVIGLINGGKPEKKKTKDEFEVKKHGQLTIKIPKTFEQDNGDENDNVIYYDYSDKDLENVCIVKIENKDAYDVNLEQEAKDNIYVDGTYQTEKKEINGKEWSIASIKYNLKTVYYAYVTTHNNQIYVVKYDDLGPGDYCDKMYKKIMKTIEFKE
jgi:lipopolysaccharide export LptBFGC system permease protein LptF